MPSATRSGASTPSMRWPSNQISPRSGVSRPATVLRSVVLPAPFAPTSATASPARTWSETPCSATTPVPYATCASLTSSNGRVLVSATVPLAQIRGDHALVAGDVLGPSLRQLLAAVEHHNPVGERHDHLHHVLHHADRQAELAVYAAHELHGRRGLERREAGHGLVQQEQARLGGEGARDLEA